MRSPRSDQLKTVTFDARHRGAPLPGGRQRVSPSNPGLGHECCWSTNLTARWSRHRSWASGQQRAGTASQALWEPWLRASCFRLVPPRYGLKRSRGRHQGRLPSAATATGGHREPDGLHPRALLPQLPKHPPVWHPLDWCGLFFERLRHAPTNMLWAVAAQDQV